MNSIGR